jgi:hypothetical protein
MRALEARGNFAAALAVYEQLRCLQRDELRAVPGTATQALHRELLAIQRRIPTRCRTDPIEQLPIAARIPLAVVRLKDSLI